MESFCELYVALLVLLSLCFCELPVCPNTALELETEVCVGVAVRLRLLLPLFSLWFLSQVGGAVCRGLAVPDEERAPWTFQRQWWPAEEEQGINPIDYLFLFFKPTIQVLLA